MSSRVRVCALLWAAVAGCTDQLNVAAPPDVPINFPPRDPEMLARIREDFNNRELIGSESGGVIVDVNRGIVTLQSQLFPEFSGDGTVSAYDQLTYQNGLVEAEQIIVHESATVEASDSVELRAKDRVIIAGTLLVGRGGITIIARQRIQIDGLINSEGPVLLLLGDDTGTIQISGQITSASDVAIYGRGSVLIRGEVHTTGLHGGNIDVYSYGDLTVTGATARLHADGEPQGTAGDMTLQSESNVILESGASLGGANDDFSPEMYQPGGSIEIKAANITVGDDVRVAGTGTNLREGAKVWMTAIGRLVTGHRAEIRAGFGPDGGSVVLKARTIELGEASRVLGGSGTTQPGNVDIGAVDSISMFPFATIEGGSGQCWSGGDITIGVGGLLSIAEDAQILGGAGNTNTTCGRGYPGGAIIIFAREAVGLDEAIVPGRGATEGTVSVNLLEDYAVAAPNLAVGNGGQVESNTIDRGEASMDSVPRLVELVAETAAGTNVTVLLAGATSPEGPFTEWLAIGSDPNDKDLEQFVGQRYVRYRVLLEGRKFDVPVLDYFEIDLAPTGY